MAEVSQRVLDMVRRELVQNPDVDNAVLYEKAQNLDAVAMKDVDRRQFNARYPLRVKRFEMKARKPKKPGEAKPPRASRKAAAAATADRPTGGVTGAALSVFRQMARDGVRDVFLRFAQDLANAESRGQLVAVVAGVDEYVDQVMGLEPIRNG